MEHHEKAGCLFPKIGMRNVKTALAAALCALVYYFLDRNPTFACIGAIFGMGSSFMQSRLDRKSTRLNSSHLKLSRMPSSA